MGKEKYRFGIFGIGKDLYEIQSPDIYNTVTGSELQLLPPLPRPSPYHPNLSHLSFSYSLTNIILNIISGVSHIYFGSKQNLSNLQMIPKACVTIHFRCPDRRLKYTCICPV